MANELTVVHRIKKSSVALAKMRFKLAGIFPRAVRLGLDNLNTIHFAHWAIHGDDSKSTYLLFNANYDGDLLAYLDLFMEQVAVEMNAIWETCFGFPANGAADRRGFQRFVVDYRTVASVYYQGARRGRSVSETRRAHRIAKRVVACYADSGSRQKLAAASPRWGGAFGDGAFRDLVAAPPIDRKRNAQPLTILVDLLPSEVDPVRELLEKKARAVRRQLDRQGRTHFARFVVFGPAQLPPNKLLFCAAIDGDPRAYLDELCAVDPIAEVLRMCSSVPKAKDEAVAYLMRRAVPANLQHSAQPGLSVEGLTWALTVTAVVERIARRASRDRRLLGEWAAHPPLLRLLNEFASPSKPPSSWAELRARVDEGIAVVTLLFLDHAVLAPWDAWRRLRTQVQNPGEADA